MQYRVVVVERLSHCAVLEAPSQQAAENEAHRLWEEQSECEVFEFEDSGIDSVTVEPFFKPGPSRANTREHMTGYSGNRLRKKSDPGRKSGAKLLSKMRINSC